MSVQLAQGPDVLAKGLTKFVIVGFPKSGTTTLAQNLSEVPGIHVARQGTSLDVNMDKALAGGDPSSLFDASKVNGHKFASYIYNPDSIAALADRNPDCLFMLCYREPYGMVRSWKKMYKAIADGPERDHAAWHKRKVFGRISLEQFAIRFSRLIELDEHLWALLQVVDPARLMIISQAAMATDTDAIVNRIATRLGIDRTGSKSHSMSSQGQAEGDEGSLSSELLETLELRFSNFLLLADCCGAEHIR